MNIDNSINQDEQIVKVFEPGVRLIGKSARRCIISGFIGVFLGIGGFAYGAVAFVEGSNISIVIMTVAAMLAVANANIISKNLYARKAFNKEFASMTLPEKMQYIGEYIPYAYKIRYAELVESIICFGFFSTMLAFFINAAIYDLSTNNILLVILYIAAVCINALAIKFDKMSLDLSGIVCRHWNEYLKYK